MTLMKKIDYLEGLRGMCCFIVLIDHCVNSFKPDLRFTSLTSFGGEIRRIIGWGPLNLIYSGIAPVCIFFILSGFVLSLKFNSVNEHDVIFKGIIKRYPRLVLPVLASMILMYAVFSLFNLFTDYRSNLTIANVIKESLYFVPFEHVVLTNYAMWTISFEVYGSFLVFGLLASVSVKETKLWIYCIVLIFLYLQGSYYCLFIAGMIFSDIFSRGKYHISKTKRLILFIVGLILATSPYPRSGVEVYGGLYEYIQIFSFLEYKDVYRYLMLTGSIFIFSAILGSGLFESFADYKYFRFLGKISFPLYITHSIFINVFAYVLHRFNPEVSFTIFVAVTFLTIITCLVVAAIFERLVDLPSIKIANIIANKFK